MKDFATQFCDCCSLAQKDSCPNKNLYPSFPFYNYEAWANKNCPAGKKCDVLFIGSKGLILIELKALDHLMNIEEDWIEATDEKEKRKIFDGFEGNLKKKFFNSKKNLLERGMFVDRPFPYYLVAISDKLIDYSDKYKEFDKYQLKYYLRNKFFFDHEIDDHTHAIVEECTKLERYFLKVFP